MDIPALVADLFRRLHEGQTRINLDLHAGRRPGEFVAPRHEKCGHGTLGDGASDQFQYHLYDRYEAEDSGHPALGAIGYRRICNCTLCVYKTHFFKEIIESEAEAA